MKLFALLGLLVLSAATHAGVLFDNGPLDPSAEQPISNFSGDPETEWQAADDFTLTNSITLRRVNFWGLYWPYQVMRDDFTIRIFADTNGMPAVEPLAEYRVGRVSRRRAVKYANPFEGTYYFHAYSAVLRQALTLPPGKYWLSIVNAIPADSGITWSVGAIQPSDGNLHFRDNDAGQWWDSVEGYGIAFRLRGVTHRSQ